MQNVQATLPIGTIVGDRYIIESLLGKGGFGAVYLVKDQRVKGNLFALKEMTDTSKQERTRFAFECEVLKRLDHVALPRVYRSFADDKNNRSYMLMDYIEGPNLETLRQKQPQKRFSLEEVMKMMAPIFEAVSYLHNQRPPIIHRDIKPSNIIVPSSGDQPVLVDFGIAKEFDPDSTTTAVRRCSPGYGAPEQYSRGTNTRTDIYGLGATIYTLLTGTVPDDAFYRMTNLGSHNGDPLEPVRQIVPTIPLTVSQAIERAMALNIEDRFPTIEQFWQTLNAYHMTATQPRDPQTSTPPVIIPVEAPALVRQGPITPGPLPLAANGAIDAITTQKTDQERTRKRAFLPIILLLLALALVAGALAASWPFVMGHLFTQSGTPTPVVQHKVTPTAKPTLAPTHTPTSQPTAAPTATATPPSSLYPNVAGTHYGQVHNTTGNINANLTVSLTQSQGNIGGNVTISPPLVGSGPITSGSVQKNDYIQFTVKGYNGNTPLFFYGYVNADGSMGGQYCSIDLSGRCNPNVGGQGTWNVGAASSTPGSSYSPDFFPSITETTITRSLFGA